MVKVYFGSYTMFLYFVLGCLNDCECKEPNRNTCIKKNQMSAYPTCQCNDGFIEKLDGSCVGMFDPMYNFKMS